jgi:hypothetical protein
MVDPNERDNLRVSYVVTGFELNTTANAIYFNEVTWKMKIKEAQSCN